MKQETIVNVGRLLLRLGLLGASLACELVPGHGDAAFIYLVALAVVLFFRL